MTKPTGKPNGRPSMYKIEYGHMAYIACRTGGFTDANLAELFGITETTVNNWKNEHPKFIESIKKGKNEFDNNLVEESLLKRATGYNYTETTREPQSDGGKELAVTREVTKHLAPDTRAAEIWLTNRHHPRWQKVQQVQISTPEDKDFKIRVVYDEGKPPNADD